MEELKDRRPIHEKLNSYRNRGGAAVDIDQVLQVDNHTKTHDQILDFYGNNVQ